MHSNAGIVTGQGGAAIKDLRTFIATLEKAGELVRVPVEVDWKYEVGALTRQAQATASDRPALLFEHIKDYAGHRIFTNGLGTYSRIALALGLEPVLSFEEIVKTIRQRAADPVAPVLLTTGPVKDNVLVGKEVDLSKLPVPWLSKEDGGRYIGTWHLNITKDPENGIRNVGIYRMQLLDSRRTAISISPKGHLAAHLAKARIKGEALEMAVAIGVDESLIIAAAAAPPYGTDEYHIAGGLSREAVALCKGRTVGLEVPAFAEIVLEGHIAPDSTVDEGPFLDYTGVPRRDSHAFVFEVSCLMHRNNPVFRGAAIGDPGGEDHVLFSLLAAADCLDFHGSGIRQKIQNALLEEKSFRLFQYAGRIRNFLKRSYPV